MIEKIIKFFKKDTVYFKDKEKIVKELCKSLGRTYYSLQFEKSCHFSSEPNTHVYRWMIYIDGYGGYYGDSFKEALSEFKETLNKPKQENQEIIL